MREGDRKSNHGWRGLPIVLPPLPEIVLEVDGSWGECVTFLSGSDHCFGTKAPVGSLTRMCTRQHQLDSGDD